MKKIFCLGILISLLFNTTSFSQNKTEIKEFVLNGLYSFDAPIKTDSVDAKGKKLKNDLFLDAIPKNGKSHIFNDSVISNNTSKIQAGSLTFYTNSSNFASANIKIKGLKNYKIYLDEALASNNLKLNPPHHKIDIKFFIEPNSSDTIKVTLESKEKIEISTNSKHFFNLNDMLYGKRISSGQISPDGKYLIISYSNTDKKGVSRQSYALKEIATGKVLSEKYAMRWMPSSNEYLYEERENNNRKLYRVNPVNGETTLWVENLPNGSITIAPTEDYLIITSSQEGIKEDKDVYQIITPDDRQPGWRNRSYLTKYDIQTGVSQRITFGSHSANLYDISKDGKKFIIGVSREQIEKRPHTTSDILIVDAQTLKADTLFIGEDFLSTIRFSPDGKYLAIKGSPDVFNGIGKNIDEGQTASMYDMQLYLYNFENKKITPLTKDFNPSIENYVWNKKDGMIYTSVTEGEYKTLYKIDPNSKKISKLNTGVEVVGNYSLSANGNRIVYTGSGATKPVALYTLDLKSNKSSLFEDCTTDIYKDVIMGECKEWNFVNRLGDTIQGRFYLPPNFDPSKKYPMIVNYYGGCTPTTRGLESRYPQVYYASLGYVVYVLQPSGAIGFGQKFSARHVGTWGKGVAEDIIEGVKKFCDEHKYVNSSKIGCIGASYGGFMTMYLQTVTDIFACAISHAGISNIASYWGEGYWGYSYGHVASGENYPWNAKDMYVNQSPLFNADKIHTPLLLLHGSDDTNVPHIESIQMFTALKILGREVAFVEFNGENHWILEYGKRIKWSNTIMAWFQKYLKDDSSWWDEMYPQKIW